MDLELVKFINSDLSWNAVKKGHRTMMRRPKRPATSNSDFEYEKFGVAILGQHFGEEVVDVPIKKRILMNERTKSTQEHLIKSKKSYESKQVPDLNDFSGIQLLAAAACHSSVSESPAPMESCAGEEHTTPRTESYPDGVKDDIAPIESDHSSVQDSLTQNLEGDKSPVPVPSKDVRFHWDLNTVMDEWEEQEQEQEACCDILVDPHSEKGYDLQKSESQQVKSGQEAVSEVVQEEKAASDDGSNSVEKVKARGYDSPAEDGELRVDTWQKNDVEEMECVDYESDNLNEDNSDAIESANNEVMEAVVPLPNNETQQHDKKNVPEHSQSAMSQEKDRNRSDCYSRGKRDCGQEKSTGRYYYQGRGSRWDEGWDSKRYPSSSGSSSRAKHVIGERGSYTRPERNESSHYKGIIHDRYKGGYVQAPRREDYYNERRASNYNRGAHRRRSRSRSRSKSRSWSEAPIAWNFQKKRNEDSKRESPHHHHHHHNNSNRADDVRLEEGQYRDRRDYNNNYNIGRQKSGDNSRRYPPQPSNSEYGMMNGEGRFRYNVKDNGFRYTRNQNSQSYLKQESFRKHDFQKD